MKIEFDLDPHSFIVLETLNANKNKPIKQKIIFQKIIFLTLMNFNTLFNVADFKAHLLGPYSPSIEKTTEQLIKIGKIKKNEANEFEITEEGIKILKKLHEKTTKNDEI